MDMLAKKLAQVEKSSKILRSWKMWKPYLIYNFDVKNDYTLYLAE